MNLENQIKLLNETLTALGTTGVQNYIPNKSEIITLLLKLHREIEEERQEEKIIEKINKRKRND